MVAAHDSKSCLERGEGSSPSSGTSNRPRGLTSFAGEKVPCGTFVRDLKSFALYLRISESVNMGKVY
jgi:hypothetical protein